MHSRKLTEFREEIIYKNRNPRNSRVLDMLGDETTNPTRTIPEGTIFYRGRAVDTDRTSIGIEEGFAGFSKSGSFVPPIDKTKDLRASYRFIPYLYAASSEEVAIREVCNSEGVGISLAKVVVRESLTLFDLINISSEYIVWDISLLGIIEFEGAKISPVFIDSNISLYGKIVFN